MRRSKALEYAETLGPTDLRAVSFGLDPIRGWSKQAGPDSDPLPRADKDDQ